MKYKNYIKDEKGIKVNPRRARKMRRNEIFEYNYNLRSGKRRREEEKAELKKG